MNFLIPMSKVVKIKETIPGVFWFHHIGIQYRFYTSKGSVKLCENDHGFRISCLGHDGLFKMNLNDVYVKLIDKMLHRLLTSLRARFLHYHAQPPAEIRGIVLPVWISRSLSSLLRVTSSIFSLRRTIFHVLATFLWRRHASQPL